jgi:hypothetical protein
VIVDKVCDGETAAPEHVADNVLIDLRTNGESGWILKCHGLDRRDEND